MGMAEYVCNFCILDRANTKEEVLEKVDAHLRPPGQWSFSWMKARSKVTSSGHTKL